MTIEWVRFGDALELQRRLVEPELDRNYVEVGVRSFGRGLFFKEPTSGAEIGSKRVFAIEPNDLVVSNIFAWEGAVAVAGERAAGAIGSHRFMTWTTVGDDIHIPFVAHFFASEVGLELLRGASPGSAGRNRTLSIKNLQEIKIPLPPIDEQRRIAAHLDSVGQIVNPRTDQGRLSMRATQGLLAQVMTSFEGRALLGDIAEVNPRCQRDVPDKVSFVPMAAVSGKKGEILGAEVRERESLASGYKQIISGDLIFARITPCMQNRKAAIYRSQDLPVAYGSTEFHVIRTDSLMAEWLQVVVRTDWFIEQAKSAFSGTAGQQRVPASFLEGVEVPVPTDIERAVNRARKLFTLQERLTDVSAQLASRRAALLPAARNEIFNAMR